MGLYNKEPSYHRLIFWHEFAKLRLKNPSWEMFRHDASSIDANSVVILDEKLQERTSFSSLPTANAFVLHFLSVLAITKRLCGVL
ncbi:hypothetical protein ACOSP7_024496 [Xanthoceras sorbifolium]